MESTEPNYRMYSLEQLNDALEHIDRDKYPDRVATIEKYLKTPGPRANIQKDKKISINKNTGTLFTLVSLELVFWFVVIVLAVLGFSIW